MIDAGVMAELRARAGAAPDGAAGTAGRVAAAVIVAIWVAAGLFGVAWLAG